MKKIYLQPETDIVEFELQQIIAGSLQSLEDSGGDVDVNEAEPDGDPMSRILGGGLPGFPF